MLGLGSSLGSNDFINTTAPAVAKILDIPSAPSAAAAYSLRALRNSYSGSALVVRRKSDNVEVSVDFDTNGVVSLDSRVNNVTEGSTLNAGLSTSATTLGQFVANSSYTNSDGLSGPDSAQVFIWNDQSGNSNNASQNDPAKQPTLVNAGALVTDSNSNAAIQFDHSSSHHLDMSINSLNINNLSVHTVCQTSDASATQIQFALGTNNPNRYFHYLNAGQDQLWYEGGAAITYGSTTANQHLYSFIAGSTSGAVRMFRDGTESASDGGSVVDQSVPATQQKIGEFSNNLFWRGTQQELVIYSADTTNFRTSIEAGINSFYSIF
tara:strand:+ start:192 stop:1160 length:969 start_codon:yes stop_codon:yes gene_type:complete